MSLADYLAKNYLIADAASSSSGRPKKKRKKNKNADTEVGGLIIADDDPPDLRTTVFQSKKRRGSNSDDDFPLKVPNARSAEFRKSKSNWRRVGPPAPSSAEQVAADAILASAAAERKALADASNEGPTVAGIHEDGVDDVPRMESGARAGLQTAAQTAAMVAEAREQQLRDASSAGKHNSNKPAIESETIYRDASGRIINVAMKRAEARRLASQAEAAEAAAKEALKGDVQRRERAARQAALEEAKYMPLARGADDEELNAELRAKERWNDPAREFLKTSTTAAATGADASGKGKKFFTGPAPPNRYGIRPGRRWDGVDRGNGFEREWFAARNNKERKQGLEYAWLKDE